MKKLIFLAFLLSISFAVFVIKTQPKETKESYNIISEDLRAFDDIDDMEYDNWFIQKENRKRFTIPEKFNDNKYERIFSKELTYEDKARIIGDEIAFSVFNDKKEYKIKFINKTRFGYYVHIEWGWPEENYSGHSLKIMIDFKNKVIWCVQCG